MESKILPGVQKIAVFRATALGDFIFALPALAALRAAYPQAEILYLGRDWHTSFVPGRIAGAHRVIAVPPVHDKNLIGQGLVIDPQYEPVFYNQMQAENIDLALQMQGGGDYSNPFILNLRPRFSAGLKSPTAIPLDRWLPYLYYQNEVARLLEVVSLVGGQVGAAGLSPVLPVLASDQAAAAPFLQAIGGPYAVLHPGSTDPRRCWSPARFAELGDYLAAHGLAVVLVGTSIEAGYVQAVLGSMRAPAIDLSGRLDLSALTGLLARAALFAGNDSGPLHMALAVGARALGLFWVEYLVNSLPLERAAFHPLIAWQRSCPGCGRFCDKHEIDNPSGQCHHDVSFVDEISPSEVIYAAEQLLAR
jgi:ADP-heptose:LPS heptosyltransferase